MWQLFIVTFLDWWEILFDQVWSILDRSVGKFLRAALTVHGHPGPIWKIAKMALFDPCMEFEIFLCQMTSYEPFFDFIQKKSQAPSSSVQVLIWENELYYLNNPSQDF